MNSFDQSSTVTPSSSACEAARADFSAYLDGAMTGVEMCEMASHLDTCAPCSSEFESLRSIQTLLAELGPAHPPVTLQAQIRNTIAAERGLGSHLALGARLAQLWKASLAPMALRTAGGMAIAAAMLGSLTWFFSPALAVQANDDRIANLSSPRYLYSEVPPQPIFTGRRDVPILVEAHIDSEGRVYDYKILDGPNDTAVNLRVQQNLLASVFRPATAFGIPVRGQVVMTYTGVSVRG